MASIFSRLSSSRDGRRQWQRALDEREALPPDLETTAAMTAVTVSQGIETTIEFKPIEHPIEPIDTDQPIKFPLPEPSILNDGRIWKERLSASVRRKVDLPVMKEKAPTESAGGPKVRPVPANRLIAASVSPPEHHILKLLEECNAAGD